MQNELIDKLNEIFITQGLVQEVIEPTVHLLEELDLDSFELVQLVMAINQMFSIEVQSQEIIPENFESLETLALLVKSKIAS